MATAEFSKFAGILSVALSQHHLLGFEIAQLEVHFVHSAQYATGDQWRNNSRKNEETEPKQKQHPVVDVTGD